MRNLVRVVVPAALLLIAASPAVEARLEPAFKGTVVSTYPDGRTGHLWLNRDGTYTGEGRRRKPSSGRWSVEGDQLCLKQKKPFPGPFAYCTPLPPGNSTWTAKAVTGEPITLRVIPGGRKS